MTILVDKALVHRIAADLARQHAVELGQIGCQIFWVGELSPSQVAQFIARITKRRAKCVIDLNPALFLAGDGQTDDGVVEIGMKAFHTGTLLCNHGILCGQQCLPFFELLLVIEIGKPPALPGDSRSLTYT